MFIFYHNQTLQQCAGMCYGYLLEQSLDPVWPRQCIAIRWTPQQFDDNSIMDYNCYLFEIPIRITTYECQSHPLLIENHLRTTYYSRYDFATEWVFN
jgi:hypothetical protein